MVALVLLIMQFLWKYMDDLLGKGLELGTVLELLFYATANLVPMALPLAILLSSIMLMGKMAEDNELVAMKSAGLSLYKIARPLTILTIFISIGAFLFSNYMWPYANLQMRVLVTDIQHKRPDLILNPGEPTSLDGNIITVQEKNGNKFKNIEMITYSHSIRKDIWAEHGMMEKTADDKYLVFTLFNGNMDEELNRNQIKNSKKPQRKTQFKKAIIRVNMEEFKLQRTNVDSYKETFVELLNLKQIENTVDSIQNVIVDKKSNGLNMAKAKLIYFKDTLSLDSININEKQNFNKLSKATKDKAYTLAISSARNAEGSLDNTYRMLEQPSEFIKHLKIAWHRKLTLSVSVILLFFIGISMGAIIKKGGFGLPVVTALMLFVLYYMLSITGEKAAKAHSLTPAWGMWFSSLILLPIAVFLTYKAANDSVLFDKDVYVRFFKRLNIFKKQKA